MKKNHSSRKKGFTLIELLIVIAVIGILAGVILVGANSSRAKAQEQTGRSTMRSTLTYMMLCYGDSFATNTGYVAGNDLCDDALVTDALWPAMPSGCTGFASVVGSNVFSGTCGGVLIICDAALGSCT